MFFFCIAPFHQPSTVWGGGGFLPVFEAIWALNPSGYGGEMTGLGWDGKKPGGLTC